MPLPRAQVIGRFSKQLTGLCLAGLSMLVAVAAEDTPSLARENAALRERVGALEDELAALRREVAQLAGRLTRTEDAVDDAGNSAPPPRASGGPGRIILSGEVGVGYTDGEVESDGPTGQFAVQEAKLFVDAEVLRGVYGFAEIDVTIEENQEEFLMGELYLEVEDVARRLGLDHLPEMTLRLGRLDIPFGEEYLARGVLSNPLISHSLADFWGVDEGIEVFGTAGMLNYFVAVQNGSHDARADFTDDKSLTLRLAADLAPRLHVSFSAIRTGEILAVEERLSELWWGGGFLRSIGNPATTTTFRAGAWQLAGTWRWDTGHLKAAGGLVLYDDNDSTRSNARDMRHLMIEGVQGFGGGLYGALRYSWIDTDGGYPIAGQGDFGKYFFGPFFSDEVWRLTAGLGYRWTDDFLFKVEYSLERGTLSSGADRKDMDQLATQAAVRF